MRKINAEIEGIAPILFNRFTEEAIEAMEKMSGGKKKTKKAKVAEAADKVYRNGAGVLCIPSANVKKCILEGCGMAGFKIGRRSAVPFMRALVFIEEDMLSFGVKEADGVHELAGRHLKDFDGIHECTGRIPPKTGARAVIRRPYLDTGWILRVPFIVVDERINDEMLHGSLQEAGLLVGLCDHRPDFGRFKVNNFEVEKQKA